MGKAADWLREERRKVLGDWVAFCLECGGALRYFAVEQVPDECLHCGGELRSHCPACRAQISSVFAVSCEECGQPLREGELLGLKIRRQRN
jgi:hypothetical protein